MKTSFIKLQLENQIFNFLPQVDQKVHQVLQILPHAFCFGDVRRHDSLNKKKVVKSKTGKIIRAPQNAGAL